MLSDTKVRQAKPQEKVYRIADARGLAIEIRPTGQKIWRYRFRLDGKANMFTIGEYPSVSLSEARKKLEEARELVSKGINPNTAKKTDIASRIEENANTFRVVADDWIQTNTHWSDTYRKQVRKTLEVDIFPCFGDLPIREISSAQVLAMLNGIIKRNAPLVARNARQWAGAVFRHGITTLRCETDPTQPLNGVIKVGKVNHHRPLKPETLPGFLKALYAYKGYGIAKPAAQLMMLTFVRTIEIRRAEWSDIDLENGVWRIPPEKMKMRTEHIVPLSRQSIAILRELQSLTGHHLYVFPNTRRPHEAITSTTINRVIEYMGYKGIVSGHGFRSTASTILHELGYPEKVIELQLAHMERNKVKAAYNHAQHMEERRKMMQDWADYLDQLRTRQ
ncbi:MAG: tyrosine-type recombinase/integrase [Laribacter sp.]|nr:tyrosine-type recombinase/integrase [Laribacter sp.]MBP9607883.1 tyrosine-type recombinase/integrase [Laribacter sp.]